jgi:hypothetical protein
VAKFNLAFASLKPGDNFGWEDILVPIVIPGWINGGRFSGTQNKGST